MSFEDSLDSAARWLREHACTIVAHADADGICAATILSQITRGQVRFLSQISTAAIENLSSSIQTPIVFLDTGSSHARAIQDAFDEVLIIDHHQSEERFDSLINPTLQGIDGTRECCTSTICYELARRLSDDHVRFAPIALIAAQADNQELGAFCGFNKVVLDEGIAAGLVTTRSGARLYGVQTRPLVSLLTKSRDLKMPALRDRRGAAQYLRRLDISEQQGARPRFYSDLLEEERNRLEEALLRDSGIAAITHYTMPGMPRGALRDTREAATLLNSCARLGKPALALAMLRGDAQALAEGGEIQREYAEAINAAHRWYEAHPERVTRSGPLLIIDAQDAMPADLAGTLCSVLTKSGEVAEGTIVLCLARNLDGSQTTKVSVRSRGADVDLALLVRGCAEAIGGEGGGHAVAAGAVIPTEGEASFVERLKNHSL